MPCGLMLFVVMLQTHPYARMPYCDPWLSHKLVLVLGHDVVICGYATKFIPVLGAMLVEAYFSWVACGFSSVFSKLTEHCRVLSCFS